MLRDLAVKNHTLEEVVRQQQSRIRELEGEPAQQRNHVQELESQLPAVRPVSPLVGRQFIEIPGSSPPVLLVMRRARLVVCVHCAHPIDGLFTHAWNIMWMVVQPERVDEAPVAEDDDIYNVLSQAETVWHGDHVRSITAVGGRHNGLMALGAGSNKQKTERAARLALAVAGRCTSEPSDVAELYPVAGDCAESIDFDAIVQLCRFCLGRR